MKNIEIKKQILNDTKRVQDFTVVITLWNGQGCDFDNAYWIDVDIFEGIHDATSQYWNADKLNNYTYYLGDEVEETVDNEALMTKNSKKLYDYLVKHFDNVITSQCTV